MSLSKLGHIVEGMRCHDEQRRARERYDTQIRYIAIVALLCGVLSLAIGMLGNL